jgi:hypothetical protein
MTQNTWCDVCQQADLGLTEPVEYEEDGAIFVEGRCAKCENIIKSRITQVDP